MTNETLEAYAIAIPAMPNNINFVLFRGLQNSLGSGSWKVKAGDWVKVGEEIVNFHGSGTPFFLSSTKISIVAPVSGKIIMCGNDDLCFWSRETQSPKWDTEPESRTTLVIIQPVKGADVKNVVSKAYTQVINFIARFINEPKKLKVSRGELNDEIWEGIKEDQEMLKNAGARIQPLSA